MKINVLSAYQTTAEEFFNKILGWKATLVLDIRLKNTNQLSGFTKQEDLRILHPRDALMPITCDVRSPPRSRCWMLI